MLMPRKAMIAGALGLVLSTPALAEEHVVVLTGFSYFPAVTYANPGDIVRFINESGDTETVVGKDAGWVIGPLNNGDEGTLMVTAETELLFYSAYDACSNGNDGTDGNCGTGDDVDPGAASETDYGTYDGATIKAEISFEEPNLVATAPDD